MRIIAGECKGRKLQTPPGNLIRPTAEKVKGAIFSMLQDRMEDSYVCDLFAGTGNLGLEALSRGAGYCVFGDHAQEGVSCIRNNVAHCRMEDRSAIIHGDYRKTLSMLKEPVDIFFLDPPYKKNILEEAVAIIAKENLLRENGVIVAEHGSDKTLPEELSGFTKVKEKKYGIVVISLYM